MKNFKLGLQLYSVRDDMAADFEGTLKKVAEMGYEYVEFAGYFGKTAEEIKALLEKYSLKCISVHQNIDLFLEKGQEAVDYIKTFGVKYAVVPWYSKDKLIGTEHWEETVSNFTKVAALLKANGMQLLYHNHDFELVKYEDKYILDWLFETVGIDNIKPEPDTCWIRYADVDPCAYIEKYEGHIDVLHLKDFVCKHFAQGPAYALIDKSGNAQKAPTREENGFKFKPVGEGMQDMPAILRSAEKIGVEYLIVEQDQSPECAPLESAKISIDNLKKFLYNN